MLRNVAQRGLRPLQIIYRHFQINEQEQDGKGCVAPTPGAE